MKAIITGGGSGLGYEIAKQLKKRNIELMLIGQSKEKLNAAKEGLQYIETGAAIECFAFDIADQNSVSDFFNTLKERNENIAYLFNVAGSFCYAKAEEITYKAVMDTLRPNMIGLMLMTANAVKYFKSYPDSKQRIISVLSTAALKGKKYESVYNAAKWGARGFLESIRDEVASTNIDIINVFPGGMKTPFWDDCKTGYDIQSFMEPEDAAKQIVSIAVDFNTYVSDVTINRPRKKQL